MRKIKTFLLRDAFAAAALMGLLARGGDVARKDKDEPRGDAIARIAYDLADRMLAERGD
jgi:hypothetical protein